MKTESETKKSEAPAGIKKLDVTKVAKEDAKVQQKEAPVIDRSLKNKEQSVAHPTAPVPQTEAGIMKPSQVKATGSIPASNQQKPQEKPQDKSSAPAPPKPKLVNDFPIIQTPPPVAPTAQRRAPEPERRPAPARVQQVKQPEESKPTFTGTADLESMDFVRRPTRPPPQQNVTPSITVIPSTPKPSDVPVPPSPTHDIIVKKASANTPPTSQPKETPKPAEPSASKPQPPKAKPEEPKPKPAEPKAKPEEPKPKPAEPKAKPEEPKPKPAEPKEKPKEKAAAPKAPAEKSQEQKPSTPPAAAFQNNSSSSANEPLIKAEPKKGGWL
ncbi:proteoglycan 4-like [Portunus trituberculatus]|uniref:proteoglycan 4-like n=1 Tax=Portunus trituberculatus TaxID=210409 RepID=UPI001E1CD555|nr:proteoglycan 4-like [Portunus trituberculatus]